MQLNIKYINLNTISLFAFMLLSISSYSQSEEAARCCLPRLEWHFNQMGSLCNNDYNSSCGFEEVSSYVCDDGCTQTGSSIDYTCCNYYSTHGTPSLITNGSTSFLQLWGHRPGNHVIGEGIKFCVDAEDPICYNLSFAFKAGSHVNTYSGTLIVYVLQQGILPEFVSSTDCFEPAPLLPAGTFLQIANIDMSLYDGAPYSWYYVSIDFATTSDVLTYETSGRGFEIWMHSNLRGATQYPINIDNVVLTELHHDPCEDIIFLDQSNEDIIGNYEAVNSIQLSGNPFIDVTEANFKAGDFIFSDEVTLYEAIGNSQINFTIEDNCEPCEYQIEFDEIEEPDPFSQYINEVNYLEGFVVVEKEKENMNNYSVFIIDPIIGIVGYSTDLYMEDVDSWINSSMNRFLNNNIYYINIMQDNIVIESKIISTIR